MTEFYAYFIDNYVLLCAMTSHILYKGHFSFHRHAHHIEWQELVYESNRLIY